VCVCHCRCHSVSLFVLVNDHCAFKTVILYGQRARSPSESLPPTLVRHLRPLSSPVRWHMTTPFRASATPPRPRLPLHLGHPFLPCFASLTGLSVLFKHRIPTIQSGQESYRASPTSFSFPFCVPLLSFSFPLSFSTLPLELTHAPRSAYNTTMKGTMPYCAC
jgi:hypothetical protein